MALFPLFALFFECVDSFYYLNYYKKFETHIFCLVVENHPYPELYKFITNDALKQQRQDSLICESSYKTVYYISLHIDIQSTFITISLNSLITYLSSIQSLVNNLGHQ